MLNLKINIQRKMCWQACNKWCNYLWFFSHFRLSIMMTLQGMTEKMFFHLLMFRPRRRTQTSKSLLQQNNEFPVYANCLLLILNFVMGILQFWRKQWKIMLFPFGFSATSTGFIDIFSLYLITSQTLNILSRVNHGYPCSGMLPSHYSRFSNGAGISASKSNDEKFSSKSTRRWRRRYTWILQTKISIQGWAHMRS